jgi:microcystin-dependent protein
MGEPFVGEIRMFGGSFAPAGWAFCSGQLLPISENDVLFTLIGTTYGGDGQETFALPDLQGRAPMHMGTAKSGTTYTEGEAAGVETVTLNANSTPIHTHAFIASIDAANQTSPTNQVLAQSGQRAIYRESGTTTALAGTAISPVGGSQPHDNMQPFLVLSFIISLFGVFPTQT